VAVSAEPVLERAALERLHRIGGAKLLRQMVDLYLANGPERVRSLVEGMETGDLERAERAAHTLKSSAGNVGAARLQRSAETVEAMVAAGTLDAALVRRVVQDYEDSVAALQRELESGT
jgi:HPt (histidine-containing phosphotransfer) domain-containing protein